MLPCCMKGTPPATNVCNSRKSDRKYPTDFNTILSGLMVKIPSNTTGFDRSQWMLHQILDFCHQQLHNPTSCGANDKCVGSGTCAVAGDTTAPMAGEASGVWPREVPLARVDTNQGSTPSDFRMTS